MTGQQFNLPSSWGSCSDVVQLYTTLLGLSIVNRFPILWLITVFLFPDCPDGHTFGKKCSFKCSPQAKLSGNGASVTCEADGKWSAQTAFCVMTCSKPVIPKNGEPLTGSSCFTSKGTILPGYSCKFRCKPGYRPKDRDGPARRALKVRCTKSGQWTHPSCEPIVCEKISASLLMWYNCSNGNALGSVCSSHCLGEGVSLYMFLACMFYTAVSGWGFCDVRNNQGRWHLSRPWKFRISQTRI